MIAAGGNAVGTIMTIVVAVGGVAIAGGDVYRYHFVLLSGERV